MAGLQVSDFVNFGKIAWDVYNFGWNKDFNATRQYVEFGRDLRGLAANLDILSRVVSHADQSLREQSSYQSRLRWDPWSLNDIIGDYQATLQECSDLLRTNRRYHSPSGPVRNIEWNVLVQPQADRLRQRILMHNSKILHVMKPFEVDLLCRVRQDIQRMHHDLAERITAVHRDVRQIMGILTPNVDRELEGQAHREIHFIDVPVAVAERFRQQSLADRPEYGYDVEPALRDLTDAFILHFSNSTAQFVSGMLIETRMPPVGQYLNLLKCVWLAGQFRGCKLLTEPHPESHWPSYVRQLEDELSLQCSRFSGELVAPNVLGAFLTPVMYSIWPEKEKAQLVDVVTRDELMEEILEVPQVSHGNVERKIQLLRRLGSNGKRFRITIYGTEQTVTGRPNSRAETIDFDISSIVINPLYALPTASGGVYDMILRKDERIATLQFTSLRNALKFQNAITGYKIWQSFSQYHVRTSFIVSGQKQSVDEIACIQLWLPKPMDGKIVKKTEATPDAQAQSRSASVVASPPAPSSYSYGSVASPISVASRGGVSPMPMPMAMPMPMPMPMAASPDPYSRSPDRSPSFDPRQPPSFPQFQTGPDGMYPSWQTPPMQSSQLLQSTSLGIRSPSPSSRFGTSPTSQLGTSLTNLHPQYSASPSNQYPNNGWPTPPSSSSPTLAPVPAPTRPDRSLSMSSNVSTAPASTSSGESHTVTVSVGRSTGYLYRQPSKPLLVLFTQSRATGALSLVTVQLDEDTVPNPERCNCRRSGSAGASCTQAAIECKKGSLDLEVHRFDSVQKPDGDLDWNVARLAYSRRDDKDYADTAWKGVRRVTLDFPSPAERARFVGTPNQCGCKTKLVKELRSCLAQGHRGMMGEVHEFYRRQCNEYHDARNSNRKEVVKGVREE